MSDLALVMNFNPFTARVRYSKVPKPPSFTQGMDREGDELSSSLLSRDYTVCLGSNVTLTVLKLQVRFSVLACPLCAKAPVLLAVWQGTGLILDCDVSNGRRERLMPIGAVLFQFYMSANCCRYVHVIKYPQTTKILLKAIRSCNLDLHREVL